MKYWLVKTEPDVYSIEDLKRDKRTLWTEVRNYQARNYLRDMAMGDLLLVYHSNANPSGVVGIATVSKVAVADPTQFDPSSEVYDPKASPDAPRWFCPEVQYVESARTLIPLAELRERKELKNMELLRKGSRLSVQPVSEPEFSAIKKLF